MAIGINSGAFWGLISVIFIFRIIFKVRRKRAERGWKRYDESQIYRPDEWARIRRAIESDSTSDEGSPVPEGRESVIEPGAPVPEGRESVIEPGAPEVSESGSHEQRERIPSKPDSLKQFNSTGDKERGEAGKPVSIAIPDVEPIDDD